MRRNLPLMIASCCKVFAMVSKAAARSPCAAAVVISAIIVGVKVFG
jgi:hypothetical protein